MVAGKEKSTMGLRRSSANPKPDSSKKKPVPSPTTPKVAQKVAAVSRPFGVYFPRASTQVQPRPPDVNELIRLVEVLRARESLLKTQLLEQKLLKESTAILPRLEKEISSRDSEIERSKKKIECLEAENDRLRQELEVFHVKVLEEKSESEKKTKAMETEVSELKKAIAERNRIGSKGLWNNEVVSEGTDDLPSSRGFQEFIDVSVRSSLIKNLKRAAKLCDIGPTDHENRIRNEAVALKRDEEVEAERSRSRYSQYGSQDFSETSQPVITARSRLPRVPKPPPRRSPSSPSTALSSSLSFSHGLLTIAEERSSTEPSPTPTPPPPPPPSKAAPPPPPPLPAKGLTCTSARVRRVPEVVEFYQSLMRRDSRRDSMVGASESPTSSVPANARDMIGEIENRSAHLHAIKTDVETQGDFIRFLIKEVENAAFTHIDDVVPFVKWLDDELSHLVDERAVLKHFNWPEQKADALREAAFGYADIKKLESQASSFRDNAGQPCASALKKMQALLEKLEHGVYNLSRMRESAAKRYKLFQIPVDWMLDTGCATQIKLASVKLAMKYLKRVSAELEIVGSCPEEEELIVQGVRFAFRVHQFAGGFDAETMKAFQELRDKARSCHIQCQNQQQQKFVCRSMAW